MTDAELRPGPLHPDAQPTDRSNARTPRLLVAGLVVAVVAGIILRLVSTGPLWLDETLSTEIARRPLGAMFTALRHDGSPPLYYLLLHGWIAAFGDSTVAVRSLSSVLAVLSLPLAWATGRQLDPRGSDRPRHRQLAPWALFAVAMAPWTFRYGTEARMYMLLFDLVLAGGLVLARALERPTTLRLALVTADTLAIAYTHYWGLYVLAPVAVGLAVARRWRVLAAMALAVIGYLPWLPSLVFQLRHTGTPWAAPPSLYLFSDTVLQWGGPGQSGPLLGIGLLLLAAAGLVLTTRGPRTDGRLLVTVVLVPLVLALLLGYLTHAGFAIRYTAVSLPAYLLLVALGLTRLPGRGQAVAATAVVVLGVVAGVTFGATSRTQAGTIAATLARQTRPGDVIGYCPDQVAPAVHRLLPSSLGVTELAYADSTEGPALVDWVDYAQRARNADPQQFASTLLAAAGPTHTVWLVSQDGFRLFNGVCPSLAADLATARGEPTIVVNARTQTLEHESVLAYPIRVTGG